jgi:hypothetical protein
VGEWGTVSWSRESVPTWSLLPNVRRGLRAVCACLPSAEPTTASPPVRAGLLTPPGVKAVQVGYDGLGGHARLGLDTGWYTS